MTDQFPEDRIPDVAQAIEESHYPDVHKPGTFLQDAKSFVAAFNACSEITSEGEPTIVLAPGGVGPGPVTLLGAVPGMRVASVVTVPPAGISSTDFSPYFERVISRKDEIQQKSLPDLPSPNLAGVKLQFTLRPPRVLRDQATNGPTLAGGDVLFFKFVPSWVRPGLFARDMKAPDAIPPHTTVTAIAPTTVTLSTAIVAPGVGLGDPIHFSHVDETPATAPSVAVGGFGANDAISRDKAALAADQARLDRHKAPLPNTDVGPVPSELHGGA